MITAVLVLVALAVGAVAGYGYRGKINKELIEVGKTGQTGVALYAEEKEVIEEKMAAEAKKL